MERMGVITTLVCAALVCATPMAGLSAVQKTGSNPILKEPLRVKRGHDNISAFGGDPNRITIAGQSLKPAPNPAPRFTIVTDGSIPVASSEERQDFFKRFLLKTTGT